MRLLLFCSRVALLCNVLFVVCAVIQRTHDFIHNQDISNYVIILGWFVAPLLNIAVNGGWLFSLITKKKRLPLWLGLTNFLFLVAQFMLYFIFYK